NITFIHFFPLLHPRQPSSTLFPYTTLFRSQPADPAERQQLLADLVLQMERLTNLVGDLIDVARDEEMPVPFEELRLDEVVAEIIDRKSTRLNSSHDQISYAVFCLKKKKNKK